ncbi:cell division protein FtsZ [bacterium]|nr:cell division protein FtsZ [bacterium]
MSNDDILERLKNSKAYIKVFGIGGAGVNAVNNMIDSGLEGVEFFAANTDAQALASSKAQNKIQLGQEITKGLGAGADPDIGYAAAQESEEEVRRALEGADMVFITAGLGGGTGTLGSSVVAEVAKEMGCLTVGVVTKPFLFEGKRRMKNAERGMVELANKVDTLITIPNQRLLSVAGRNTSLLDTFKKADDILFQAVKGISDLIFFEGLVNVDFADVRAVMAEMGMAMMGTGESSGDNRALEAAEKAVSSPLLEDISIHGAKGVLINVTASSDVTLQEVNEAAELIHSEAHDDANIIWGMVIDPEVEDKVRVTVIATGFGKDMEEGIEVSRTTNSGVGLSTGGLSAGGLSAGGSDQGSSQQGNSQQSTSGFSAGGRNTGAGHTPLMRAGKENVENDTVRTKKLPVLSGPEDQEKYEIPTFLRKQGD